MRHARQRRQPPAVSVWVRHRPPGGDRLGLLLQPGTIAHVPSRRPGSSEEPPGHVDGSSNCREGKGRHTELPELVPCLPDGCSAEAERWPRNYPAPKAGSCTERKNHNQHKLEGLEGSCQAASRPQSAAWNFLRLGCCKAALTWLISQQEAGALAAASLTLGFRKRSCMPLETIKDVQWTQIPCTDSVPRG